MVVGSVVAESIRYSGWMTPRAVFRCVATAEAVTWALLLCGMVLKYVTKTTDVAVSVFGLAHGVVFLAYVAATLLVAVNGRWGFGTTVAGLAAALPPFATIVFERWAVRRSLVGGTWRDVHKEPGHPALDAVFGAVVSRPKAAAVVASAGVVVATVVLLILGKPY